MKKPLEKKYHYQIDIRFQSGDSWEGRIMEDQSCLPDRHVRKKTGPPSNALYFG